MSQQNSSTVNINNVDHDITITFDDSNQQIAHIGYTLINRISIFTNIFDPFFSGELEYIDEFALEKAANNKDANINATTSYRYRGDGYDKLTYDLVAEDLVHCKQPNLIFIDALLKGQSDYLLKEVNKIYAKDN